MKTESFYITKKTLMALMDEWLDKRNTLKIEIHPVTMDEFLVYRHMFDEDEKMRNKVM